MEAITYRTLTTDAEIAVYMQRFGSHVKVKLPYDYIARSKVVGAFRGDNMVAGYMLVTKPSFRSLSFVPDEIKKSNKFFKNEEYEMMEVNALWIGAAVKSPSEQFAIWLHMLKDVFACRKKYVLLMADPRNSNICRIHGLMGKQELYDGPALQMAGMQTHDTITVGYATRWSLIFNMPKYIAEYRQRLRRSAQRGSRVKSFSDVAKAG
jgi:hypothetical protein